MRHISVLLLLAGAAFAQAQNPPFRVPPGVAIQRDLVYARYGARQMHLDLFLPESGRGPFPAVVYVHGGGWRNGSKAAFQRQAAYMASRGFAGACIEYRLSGEAKWPAAIHDAKAAVRWLRANAARYRIDPERIGAAGGSAGGHLVGLLGTTAGMAKLEGDGGNPGVSSRVKAVAAFNPAVDLVMFGKLSGSKPDNSVSAFLGASYKEKPELWAEATPLLHVSKDSAAFLFLHGDADMTVPYRQSVDMQKRLQAVGVAAELFTAPGAQHGFFNRPPWFESTLKRMEEFFVRYLK
ncbi:MAG: alpha/beta hydrolase fold domain-containing protein [Bryobacteraceae bacterium]